MTEHFFVAWSHEPVFVEIMPLHLSVNLLPVISLPFLTIELVCQKRAEVKGWEVMFKQDWSILLIQDALIYFVLLNLDP